VKQKTTNKPKQILLHLFVLYEFKHQTYFILWDQYHMVSIIFSLEV